MPQRRYKVGSVHGPFTVVAVLPGITYQVRCQCGRQYKRTSTRLCNSRSRNQVGCNKCRPPQQRTIKLRERLNELAKEVVRTQDVTAAATRLGVTGEWVRQMLRKVGVRLVYAYVDEEGMPCPRS